MAPMLKRSKIIDAGSRISKSRPKSISAFGKVSKASAILVQYNKQDNAFDLDQDRKHKSTIQAVKSKKRQREEESEQSLQEQSGNIIQVALDQYGNTASRKKARFAISAKSEQIGTKENVVLVGSLNAAKAIQVQDIFDQEIQDLIDLHIAFLNALAIHYAHNGTASPVDLKTLIPRIESRWGKRRITLEDIQRILGIQHSETQSALSLVERTKSRVCIEYNSEITNTLPVETLKRAFITACKSLQGAELPLEPIKAFVSTENVFLSKGAQRLQQLKAAAIQAQPSPSPPKPITQNVLSTTTSTNRAASLLDRIRTKETLLSALPAAPTPEVLARKASLQRLEEIIPILCVLTSGSSSSVSSRNLYTSTTSLASLSSLGASLGLGPAPPAKVVSFTMGNIVQQLQNSMRHPMAGEDVVRAVQVLADEVAPRWVSVRDVGSVVGVTFRGKIGRAEWSARLAELLAEL